MDGQDGALIRAAIADDSGQAVTMASHNVTFQVIKGPGVIQGTGSGNPKSYEFNDANSHLAYHGLVRAIVRVTSHAALSNYERSMIDLVDTSSLLSTEEGDIVVEASTPGLASVQLVIPTSTNPKDDVLEIASAGAGIPVNFFRTQKSNHQPDNYMTS